MNTDNILDCTPDATWSLAQLGACCLASARKLAVDGWLIGTALDLAYAKCESEGRSWIEWCEQYSPWWSRTTIWRYRQLAHRFSHADLLGQRLSEAYDVLGLRGN